MRRYLRLAIVLPLAMGSLSASALDLFEERLRIHGFASQAVVDTSDNQYFGDSTGTSFDFTELGLNASYRFTPRILLSSQVLVRRAGDMYDGTPSIDYALADITASSTSEARFGARLGRIKNPLGLYNETRDVPFTRPGIFLPQVIYYDKVRNLVLSSDGVMFFGETYGEAGTLSLNLGVGQPIIDDNAEWTYLGDDFEGRLEPRDPTWIANLWIASPTERLRAGLGVVASSLSYDAFESSFLESGSIGFINTILSLQYNDEQWTLSAEYSRMPLEWKEFGPVFPFSKQTTEGYYLQGAYRPRPNLELSLRYEEGFADRNDRDGSRSSALTGGLTPPFDFYSKIWTAGLRWDVKPNLMLRFEYQRHAGTFALSIRENPDPSDLVKHWDAFAASISVRF
ncbi:hypothetical protein [Thiocystis violacea]|uniref:hypothetical protein n=1 Tax=Thiocystis violacea TaxID=13725 RepID=UPI001907FDEF|nr:hypothetical protein [Thiocystis violacea]MBK1716575.1 hypothetical protein [Thiocystis violacea]